MVYFGGGGNNGSFLSIWGLKLLAGWGSELGIDGRDYAKLQTQFRRDNKHLEGSLITNAMLANEKIINPLPMNKIK